MATMASKTTQVSSGQGLSTSVPLQGTVGSVCAYSNATLNIDNDNVLKNIFTRIQLLLILKNTFFSDNPIADTYPLTVNNVHLLKIFHPPIV
jgi:hypothetical protein